MGFGSFIDNLTDSLGMTDYSGDAALQAQTNAANQANATEQNMYNQTEANEQPYMQAGTQAVGQLSGSLGDLTRSFTQGDFQEDPGYQFALNQGLQAIQNSALSKGGYSGATLKSLNDYAQGQADQQYQNAYNRFTQNQQQKYNMLSGLSSLGQNAASQTGSIGANVANQVASNQIGLGNAQAASDMAPVNNMSNLINTGITAGAMYYGAKSPIQASDRRLKKNIHAVSKKDLKELKSVIRPYHFEYLDDQFGSGEHIGVMAQDLEKSKLGRTVVFTDRDGFKKIDIRKLAGLLLASISEAA